MEPIWLNRYPLFRSQDAVETRERMSRVFSPHRLALPSPGSRLDVLHNRISLGRIAISVLRYGADVVIDSDRRGDFYMVQLPLSGSAQVWDGSGVVTAGPGVMSILQPGIRNRMEWSGDCSMILVQVPRFACPTLDDRDGAVPLRLASIRSRHDDAVAAWWQVVEDLVRNLDRFGESWLANPVASAAAENFLLLSFRALLGEPLQAGNEADARDRRRFSLAVDYLRRHLDRAVSAAEVAAQVGVSTRQLELVFKRCGEASPMAYARQLRLQAVHDALLAARREGRHSRVTQVALDYGFTHMGRFATQYRAQFGHSPSVER